VYQIFFKSSKQLTITLCLLCLNFNAKAQSHSVTDSLRQILNTKKDIDRFDVLYELAFEYIDNDNQLALKYSTEAEMIGLSFSDSLKVVKGKIAKGLALRKLDQINESVKVFSESLTIAKRNNYKKETKYLLNAIAINYSLRAEYDKALDFHLQSLILREAEGNKSEISIALNNIGFVYFKLKNYEKAIEYFDRALELRKEANETYDMDRLLINIGLSHTHLKNFAKAEKYIKEGLAACAVNCNDQIQIEGEFGLGVAAYGLEKYDDSKKHFEKSLEISLKIVNKRFQAENLIYLAKIATIEDESIAELHLERAEKLAVEAGYKQLLMDIYKQFFTYYNKTNDFKNASFYKDKYITLKDSLIGEELVKNIEKIQTSFAERQNIQTIANNEVTIQRQRSLSFAIAIIAILAGMLIFVLYKSNRVTKKVNQALSDAKAIIEDQNKQLLNSNFNLDKEVKEKNADLEKANESLRSVNDELDNFIYKTSHDIRGPLASLKGMCNVALMDVHDPVALGYLKKLDITAEKLNTILTRLLIVNQINNSALASDKIDFNAIVNDVLLLEKKKGLPARLKVRKYIDESIDFYSDKEFVRIILENLIDNAIKFYNDSERIEPFVDISVTQEEDFIKIRVIDNGIGISEVHPDKIFQMFSRASERSETGGIGLYITKTAAEKLGGTVNLKTTPDGHTEFYARIPLAVIKTPV
jgi:signal transduction histidine kinase/Tfp pilus assembly protein PilF